MSTDISMVRQQSQVRAGDDLDHIYCCDIDLSLCGLDISHFTQLPVDDDDLCVVCADLESQPCPDPACPDCSP